jgi:2-keto-4-pentenoate hydratase
MTNDRVAAAADLLEKARGGAKLLSDVSNAALPRDLAEGYRVQAELARRAGKVGAWKVSGVDDKQKQNMKVDAPIGGRIFAKYVQASPAKFEHKRFIKPLIECEFAFALAKDLPARDKPYTRADVEAAIGALHPAIEIADTRLPAGPPPAVLLADSIGNGAFVYGEAHKDWRKIDVPKHNVVLRIDGKEIARGVGSAILGDPLAAVVMLANAQPKDGEGLRAGQIVTTGSCTGALPIAAGAEAVADFGVLGEVRVRFTP